MSEAILLFGSYAKGIADGHSYDSTTGCYSRSALISEAEIGQSPIFSTP